LDCRLFMACPRGQPQRGRLRSLYDTLELASFSPRPTTRSGGTEEDEQRRRRVQLKRRPEKGKKQTYPATLAQRRWQCTIALARCRARPRTPSTEPPGRSCPRSCPRRSSG
jgi:hypothetical protein